MGLTSLPTVAAIHRKHKYKIKWHLNAKAVAHQPTIRFYCSNPHPENDCLWTDPNGATLATAAPPNSFFALEGDYTFESRSWGNIVRHELSQPMHLGSAYDAVEADWDDLDFRYLKNLNYMYTNVWSVVCTASNCNLSECREMVTLRIQGIEPEGEFGDLHLENMQKLEVLDWSGTGARRPVGILRPSDMEPWKFPKLKALAFSNINNAPGDVGDAVIGSNPYLERYATLRVKMAGNIGNLDFSQCPELKQLGFYFSSVTDCTDLDMSANTKLEYVNLAYSYQMHGDISTIKLPASLTYFNTYRSPVTGDIANIDITHMPLLTDFGFGISYVYGDIANWDTSNNPLLRGWGCQATDVGGDITSIDISNLTNITGIYLDGNRRDATVAKHFTGELTDAIDLANHPKLQSIVVRDQMHIDINLNALDINACPNFRSLYTDRSAGLVGDISTWDVHNHPNFTGLNSTGCSLSGDLAQNKLPDGMYSINLSSSYCTITGVITNIDFGRFSGLYNLWIEGLHLTGNYADFNLPSQLHGISLGSYGSAITDVEDLNVPNSVYELHMRQHVDYPNTGKFLSNPSLGVRYLRWSYCGISTQDVDNILADLAAAGNSGGSLYLTHNNPPSAAGLASRDTLLSRGWRVYVDT